MTHYHIDKNAWGNFWVFGPGCERGELFHTREEAEYFVSERLAAERL